MNNWKASIKDFLKKTSNHYYVLWGSDGFFYICVADIRNLMETAEKLSTLMELHNFHLEEAEVETTDISLIFKNSNDFRRHEVGITPYDRYTYDMNSSNF